MEQSPWQRQSITSEREKGPSKPDFRAEGKNKDAAIVSTTAYLNSYFENMGNILNSQDWVKENYLPVFQEKSVKYVELIDNTITELNEAERYVSRLVVWDFAALSGNTE